MVCKLIKSLYGLKQVSRQWNFKLIKALENSGYKRSYLDYFLFAKKQGKKKVIILVYVDDFLISGNDTTHPGYQIKILRELQFFSELNLAY